MPYARGAGEAVSVTPIRFHHLKAIGTKSAAHLRAILDGEEKEPTSAMERGSATHALLFNTKKVIFYPGAVRRGKEWEAFRDLNANDDTLILTKGDHDRASRMAESVSNCPDAMAALAGVHEKTLLWDQEGRTCRATPDAHSNLSLGELKTTRESAPGWFGRYAIRLGYHVQVAWYRQAMRANGMDPTAVHIVAVESAPPYPVTVFRVLPRALDIGDRLLRLWWERLKACEDAGQWPSYVQTIVDLDVPEDDVELVFGEDVDNANAALPF